MTRRSLSWPRFGAAVTLFPSALLQTSQNTWLNNSLRIYHSPCCIRGVCRGNWHPLKSRPVATVNDTHMVFNWNTNVYCVLTMHVTFYSVTWHGSMIPILHMIKMGLTDGKWSKWDLKRPNELPVFTAVNKGQNHSLTIFAWEHSGIINKLNHSVLPREPRNIFRSKKYSIAASLKVNFTVFSSTAMSSISNVKEEFC